MNLSIKGQEEFMVHFHQVEEGNVDLRKEFTDTAEEC